MIQGYEIQDVWDRIRRYRDTEYTVNRDIGYRIQDTGYRIPDTEYRKQRFFSHKINFKYQCLAVLLIGLNNNLWE